MAGPGNQEIQLPRGVAAERGSNPEDEQTASYIRKILRVTKERFFDTGQSETLTITDAQRVPGYISMIAITNPEQDMEAVVSFTDGLTIHGGVAGEQMGGQEIHISYRQLKGSSIVLPPR